MSLGRDCEKPFYSVLRSVLVSLEAKGNHYMSRVMCSALHMERKTLSVRWGKQAETKNLKNTTGLVSRSRASKLLYKFRKKKMMIPCTGGEERG